MRQAWLDPAEQTTAGAVRAIPVGLRIPWGDGAEARVVAANGKVYLTRADDVPFARDENDRSIALYIKYKNFDYLLDGDMGAGPETCTGHQTVQRNLQIPVAQALIKRRRMDPSRGVAVLQVAQHGSESSTSATYYNLMRSEVALISVGLNQGTFLHPRQEVVDVLLGPTRPPCVSAPPVVALFQTENGLAGTSSTGSTSFRGLPVGDIKLTTNGTADVRISGTARVGNKVACGNPASGVWVFALDEQGAPQPPQLNGRCAVRAKSCSCPCRAHAWFEQRSVARVSRGLRHMVGHECSATRKRRCRRLPTRDLS